MIKFFKEYWGYLLGMVLFILILVMNAKSNACVTPTPGDIIQKRNWTYEISELYQYSMDRERIKEIVDSIQLNVERDYYIAYRKTKLRCLTKKQKRRKKNVKF